MAPKGIKQNDNLSQIQFHQKISNFSLIYRFSFNFQELTCFGFSLEKSQSKIRENTLM